MPATFYGVFIPEFLRREMHSYVLYYDSSSSWFSNCKVFFKDLVFLVVISGSQGDILYGKMVALRNLRLRRLVVCLLLSDRSVGRYTRHCKPWLYMKKAHKFRNPVLIPVQLSISTFQTCYAPGAQHRPQHT